jgi:hypothetical protein
MPARTTASTCRTAAAGATSSRTPSSTGTAGPSASRGPDDLIAPQRRAGTLAGLLPAGELAVAQSGAHRLTVELVPVAVPFLRRHLRGRRDSGHSFGVPR